MATLHEAPRKKLATYGKAARRRIAPVNSEYNSVFFSESSKSQTPEEETVKVSAPNKRAMPEPTPRSSKQVDLPKQVTFQQKAMTSSSASVFDVPDDEDSAQKPKKTITKPIARAKVISSVKTNVFDVPSSDEDKPRATVAIKKNTIKASIPTTRILNSPKPKEPAKEHPNDAEQRKRLKSFTKEQPIKMPIPKRIKSPQPMPPQIKVSKTSLPVSKGATSIIAARPKSQVQKKPTLQRTPQKISPAPHLVESCTTPTYDTPSPQLSDVDMMDVDPQSKYISPKGLKMWKDLLDQDDEIEIISSKIGGRGRSPGKNSPPLANKTLFKPARISKPSKRSPRSIPRKRLIDFLVEQASSEDSGEDSSREEADEMEGVQSGPETFGRNLSRDQSIAPEPIQTSASASQGPQIAGPKFVYGRERTILAEQDFMKALHIEMPTEASQGPEGRRTRRGSIPPLPVLPSFHDVDLEDEEGTGAAIKSVHELRQAGVNNRFMDELDDFIERIGSPGVSQVSMRRSGLLDLANKLKDKNFTRQFRSNGAEEKLFVHLGQETDVVAGFILVSILMIIFAEGNVPHIIPQLRRQGITRLLIRLLEHQNGVLSISKERKTNMSKIAQSLLADYHGHLLHLPIWENLEPQSISPRIIALKCLEKMVRQTREAGNPGDIFSKELTSTLFEILKSASNESTWDLPQGRYAIEFFLALSALESHSITARTAHNEAIWISDFLPVIADTLLVALSQSEFGEIQLLILRLALNVTNNNPKGADVFAKPALLAVMGQVVVARFKKITRFLKEEEFFVVLDHLVLTLGVMINFAEWSTPAREALQNLEGRSDDPLDRMAQLFLDNREKMAEADSVEESQKNVAFGYLSVLLGYLGLHPAIAERIRKRNPRRSLKPLVSSIQEFIVHHKAVDEIIAAEPDGHSSHSGLTERLESLVTKLGSLV